MIVYVHAIRHESCHIIASIVQKDEINISEKKNVTILLKYNFLSK